MKVEKGILILMMALLAACGGGDSGGEDPDPEPQPRQQPPTAASLVFPENNRPCTEGVVISATRSRITFQWNASQNTDSYQVVLRDLNTNEEVTATANTNEAAVTVNRGTPYEWYVVSRANGINQTAQSTTWRFYNEGPGFENYAPFPARAIFPQRGSHINASGTVLLQWEGADADDDISGYEVFFGTDPADLPTAGSTVETELEVPISPGTPYYWVVRTTDLQGNATDSELFEFLVQ